ncbi:MAG: NADH-quinone oxidoreductase subunit K [Halobacteriovorax sp.]|nr:NADH-quinone oxidoreductase subunit K [Halobacteriovorax sp.]|tara:strand:+ start:43115 stop:43468 length:354 start_codon:yes stop_codon:yes gene_type:complete
MEFLNVLSKLYIFGNLSLNINFLFILGFSLFLIGLFGIIYSLERVIIYLMCVELMWLGVGICFLSNYLYTQNPIALVFAIAVLSIAAAETAIGLALLVNFYRINKSISLRYLSNLRG